MDATDRCAGALEIVRDAGAAALDFFSHHERLQVDRKGHQDFVSQADRHVETRIRESLARAFPGDAIVGEEQDDTAGTTGFTWVIDPIDGTANFIRQIPMWTVVLAGVEAGRTKVGIVYDPCHGETYAAVAGQGATLNGARLSLDNTAEIGAGAIGIGCSGRARHEGVVRAIQGVFDAGGVFYRNASGALSLAWVAAGRLNGYAEQHMNAWDCLAGQLLVAEAGGRIEEQDADRMIAEGGRVIAAAPGVWDDLRRIADAAFAAPG